MTHSITAGLKALGSAGTKYDHSGPHASLLECFPNPFISPELFIKGSMSSIDIRCPEFTSLCPLTGQPDFATIVISYVPGKYCVESKALKLYLGSFRQAGEFHEACVARIGRDLVTLLDPVTMTVEGQFTPRGGIPFWPKFRYHRPHAAPDIVINTGQNPLGGVVRAGGTVPT